MFELVPDATRTTQKLSFEKTFLENDKEPNPWQLRCSVPESLLARWRCKRMSTDVTNKATSEQDEQLDGVATIVADPSPC